MLNCFSYLHIYYLLVDKLRNVISHIIIIYIICCIAYTRVRDYICRSNVSAVSRSVHDLAPSLWHALDVWRCVTITGKQVEESLYSLARCGLGMSLENW